MIWDDAVIRSEANGIGRCTLPLAQIRQGQSAGRLTLAAGLGVRNDGMRAYRQALASPHLILQRPPLLLLPDLCNSILHLP